MTPLCLQVRGVPEDSARRPLPLSVPNECFSTNTRPGPSLPRTRRRLPLVGLGAPVTPLSLPVPVLARRPLPTAPGVPVPPSTSPERGGESPRDRGSEEVLLPVRPVLSRCRIRTPRLPRTHVPTPRSGGGGPYLRPVGRGRMETSDTRKDLPREVVT